MAFVISLEAFRHSVRCTVCTVDIIVGFSVTSSFHAAQWLALGKSAAVKTCMPIIVILFISSIIVNNKEIQILII